MIIKRRFLFLFLALVISAFVYSDIGYSAAKAKPQEGLPSLAELVKKENPAVVNISTTQVIKRGKKGERSPHGQGPQDKDFRDFWDDFFGELPKDFKTQSLGSGFIIRKDGLILTNNHVIEDAEEIMIRLNDEREFKAKVIGKDKKIDIALLKIEDKGELPIAELGDSDKLEIGEWVLAIGNPFGLGHTVTAGIVSAKGRVIGAGPYDDFIQTDASINPGNSGGPLFNMKGEAVGINTAITASGQGIGFAIPINTVKNLLPQLEKEGKITRGWLGVMIQEVTKDLAKSLGLKKEEGALVGDVISNGPAEKAGIMRGDVIIEFDGKKIKKMKELPATVANTPVGKDAKLKVIRESAEKVITVKIGKLPEEKEAAADTVKEAANKLGMRVQDITPELAKQFGLEKAEGVIVADVERNSPSFEAGMRRGDVILEGDRNPIKKTEDYEKLINKKKKGETLLLLIRRGESTIFVTIKVEE
ncbi:MAG: DegQ family serine endoprotease [Nitrospirae bacterium]|nr:DegQ family serine endoprotease [Nitrospirota bacterium]